MLFDKNDIRFLYKDVVKYDGKVTPSIVFSNCRECSFEVRQSRKSTKKLLNLFVYGWRTNGFLRKRALLNAWDKRIRAAGHFKEV